MPPFSLQPRALRSSGSFLRAGFATCRPRPRALPPGPRGLVRRPPPPIPASKRPLRRPQSSSKPPDSPTDPPNQQRNAQDAVSNALRNSESNNLLSPVNVPDNPNGVLTAEHPVTSILSHSALVVTRQLELMNVMLGFEQANKYVIMDPQGNHIGYMAERELGMGNMMARQMFSTHRSFTTHVLDRHGKEVLRFHRPFSWISSRIGIYDPMEVSKHAHAASTALTTSTPGSLTTEVNPESAQISPLDLSEMRIIGEAQQQWALLRRKYNLFLYRNAPPPANRPESQQTPPPSQPLSNSGAMDLTPYNAEGDFNQFAYVDEPFLSWDFSLLSSESKLIGSVNRNFAGFGREIFTDTGVYALRMDAAGLAQEPGHLISQTGEKAQLVDQNPAPGMTLDQRAVMLATAVSVDFDYFSRKSGSGGGIGGWMPMWFPGGGGGAAAGEVGAEAESEAGAMEGANREGARTRGTRATTEGAAIGAGSMAGYEAMQRGVGNGSFGDEVGNASREDDTTGHQDQPQPGEGDFWGNDNDPWGGGSQEGDDGGGDGGGDGGDWTDFFSD